MQVDATAPHAVLARHVAAAVDDPVQEAHQYELECGFVIGVTTREHLTMLHPEGRKILEQLSEVQAPVSLHEGARPRLRRATQTHAASAVAYRGTSEGFPARRVVIREQARRRRTRTHRARRRNRSAPKSLGGTPARDDGMEVTIFPARVDADRQGLDQSLVEDPAGEGAVQRSRVHASNHGREARMHYLARKLGGIAPPQRKHGVHAGPIELRLPIGANVLQEEVAERHVRDPRFQQVRHGFAHPLLVDLVGARRRDPYLDTVGVGGSNPLAPTKKAPRNQPVRGF